MSASAESGSHLTTSRISRLLRPLRTKCKALLPVVHSGTASRTGVIVQPIPPQNASGKLINTEENIPLAIIPPPGRLGSLARLDRPARGDLRLSKMIYDIRDAYRNVIQVAFGISSHKQTETIANTSEHRVRSLASTCACIVGEQMEDLARLSREGGTPDEDEDMETLNELYEAVPAHYRRFTVVSHALSLVLEICPHHPTLLHLLLEVSIIHRLLPQCKILLYQLLGVAFEPPTPQACPPVAHAVHAHFLTTLRDMCCVSHCAISAPLNDRAFVRIFIDVIAKTPTHWQAEVWTCKAVRRLARRLLSNNFVAFVQIIHTLLEHISQWRPRDIRSSDDHEGGKNSARLLDRLSRWLEAACQQVLTSTRKSDLQNEDLLTLAHLVTRAEALKSELPHGLEASVQDNLLSLSVVALSSFPYVMREDFPRSTFLDFIRKTSSQPTTFSRLIVAASVLHSADPSDTSYAPSFLAFSADLPLMRRWATTLKDHKCYSHEASLWSATLSHMEALLSAEQGSTRQRTAASHELETLRAELIDRVEKAERRSLSHQAHLCGQQVVHTPLRGTKSTTDEWRWEEVFGCWVQQTPASSQNDYPRASRRPKRSRDEGYMQPPVKRRHTTLGPREIYIAESPLQLRKSVSSGGYVQEHERRVLRAPSAHSSRTSKSISPTPARAMAQKPRATVERSNGSRGGAEDVAAEQKARGGCGQPVPGLHRRATIGDLRPNTKYDTFSGRKPVSFQTLVADALKNRIVLHPRRARAAQSQSDSSTSRAKDPTARESVLDSDHDEADLLGPTVCRARTHKVDKLSSDDALDLFACMSSER